MANGQCDICGKPATVSAQVVSNGQRRSMELCDGTTARSRGRAVAARPRRWSRCSGARGACSRTSSATACPPTRGFPSLDGGEGGRVPVRRGGRRGARGLAERVSEHAEELLQEAARQAVEFGRREVDTEHLLLALTDSDVVRTILDQFKVSLDDLKRQIEQEAPPRRRQARGRGGEIGVSPARQERAGARLRRLARARPQLRRPRAPPDRPRRGGGGHRRRRAAPVRPDAAGDAPAGRQGRRQGRRGRPGRRAQPTRRTSTSTRRDLTEARARRASSTR